MQTGAEGEVRGLAYLNGKIYTLQADSKFVIVYTHGTLDDYWVPEEIENTSFNRPQDIAACSDRNVVYILDQSCIWELDKSHKISIYVQLSDPYATMSATKEHILLISSSVIRKCKDRFIGKRSVMEVRLPVGLSQLRPWHALKVDGGHVIAHTEAAKFHRVSKIVVSQWNKAQVEVSTFGKEAGDGINQLRNPVYLALEPKHGHIFVADHDNRRVVVLDSELRTRVLMISDLPEGCYPSRLCYVEESNELLVGMSKGRVIAYKILW